MGRSRRSRRGLSRRDFLTRSAAASFALASTPLSAGPAPKATDRSSPFQHGVASGDPLSTQVILWTRISTQVIAVTVECRWSRDPKMQTGLHSVITTTSEAVDYTVKIDVTGLSPDTTYYYQFEALGAVSPIGRTRTLPVGKTDHLRLGVACCASLAHGYFNAYARLAERADLAAVLHLGDYIYEYGTGEYGSVRAYEPDHEIVSLADYRQRHAQYKTDPHLQALHRQHPVIAIWDDHETANNAWTGGAENHDEATEGSWQARVAAALQAYYEWMPVRHDPAIDPRLNYRSFTFGDLAELTMLESRLINRSEQLAVNQPLTFTQTGDFADPARELLGESQAEWLAGRLRRTEARWKLIGQQVMLAQLKLSGARNATDRSRYINPDQWDGYDPARQRLFGVLKGDTTHAPVGNVVVLTGDIHSSWGADLTPDPDNPVVAAGGYNPRTGAGSLAVEFVSTSVTSPGLDPVPQAAAAAQKINSHIRYAEGTRRGYLLVDVTPERINGEWWYVDTILDPNDSGQSCGAAYQVRDAQNHLELSQATPSLAGAPLAS
jgi:alkaline phosphatase D